jgi:FlaG/FlaF family flagellin (archaellin)
MIYRGFMMNFYVKSRDDGVSPVVGVMLMLVVTIIIAALVSAFSGGLASAQQKAPSLSATTEIRNTGEYGGSYYFMKVLSVSEPIPTKNLRWIVDWKTSKGVRGNLTAPSDNSTANYGSLKNTATTKSSYKAPLGMGPGVLTYSYNSSTRSPDQHWGNYTLIGGTIVRAGPSSAYGKSAASNVASCNVNYVYCTTSQGSFDPVNDIDGIQAAIGKGWENLRAGDIVDIKILHIPSNKIIYHEQVKVTE